MANNRNGKILRLLTVIALVAGVFAGIFLPGFSGKISFVGDIYTGLLKIIIIPLLMAQIFSVGAKKGFSSGKTVLKTVLLFFVLFAVTFLITFGVCLLLKPGEGFVLSSESWSGQTADTTPDSILKNIFCWNIFEALASGKILPCFLFALAAGIAASVLGYSKASEGADKITAIGELILKWILWISPAGVFSLMAAAAAKNGVSVILTAVKYIAFAWGIGLAVIVFVMYIPLLVFKRIGFLKYLKSLIKVWTVSLSTCSSMATLPVTMEVCKNDFSVSDEITSVVAPLGCTIHMCGGAVSFCLLAVFTAQASGVPITFGLFLEMLLMAELINMAAPGIPGGGIAIGAAYLSGLGLGLGFMGIYSGIYRVLDMIYTSLNVTGDITANILLSPNNRKKTGEMLCQNSQK